MSSSTSSSVYITLAKESPPRDYDTDDTTYDSLNEQETGNQKNQKYNANMRNK